MRFCRVTWVVPVLCCAGEAVQAEAGDRPELCWRSLIGPRPTLPCLLATSTYSMIYLPTAIALKRFSRGPRLNFRTDASLPFPSFPPSSQSRKWMILQFCPEAKKFPLRNVNSYNLIDPSITFSNLCGIKCISNFQFNPIVWFCIRIPQENALSTGENVGF